MLWAVPNSREASLRFSGTYPYTTRDNSSSEDRMGNRKADDGRNTEAQANKHVSENVERPKAATLVSDLHMEDTLSNQLEPKKGAL